MIEIKLCEPFYYFELCPEVESERLSKRFLALRKEGYDIDIRYNGIGFWRYFIARFETEAEAALFKLTHM